MNVKKQKLFEKDKYLKPEIKTTHAVNYRKMDKEELARMHSLRKMGAVAKTVAGYVPTIKDYLHIHNFDEILNGVGFNAVGFNGVRGRFKYIAHDMELFNSHTLDLHGCSLELAHALLVFFFKFALKSRVEKVFVITGKGVVLRERVVKLANYKPFAPYIKTLTDLGGKVKIELQMSA